MNRIALPCSSLVNLSMLRGVKVALLKRPSASKGRHWRSLLKPTCRLAFAPLASGHSGFSPWYASHHTPRGCDLLQGPVVAASWMVCWCLEYQKTMDSCHLTSSTKRTMAAIIRISHCVSIHLNMRYQYLLETIQATIYSKKMACISWPGASGVFIVNHQPSMVVIIIIIGILYVNEIWDSSSSILEEKSIRSLLL